LAQSASALSDPSLAGRNLDAALQLLVALSDGGVQHWVVCPGSRSGPLATGTGLLMAAGRGCLHTAIDERSAAFFALGLALASGEPAAVITTSGTAVANLVPAAVEADHAGLPLLLLTADRPSRLKGCGANQTVNQECFLAASVRWLGQGDPGGLAALHPDSLDDLAGRALAHCRGGGGQPAGPVHLNLAFDEPLHAAAAVLSQRARTLAVRLPRLSRQPLSPSPFSRDPVDQEQAAASQPTNAPGEMGLAGLDPDRPGLVVAGPWRGHPGSWPAFVQAVRRWQCRTGWPVLADGLSCLRGCQDLELVAGYDLVGAQLPAHLSASLADLQVLRLGPLPASRRLQGLLEACGGLQLLITEGDPRPLDPLGRCAVQCSVGLAGWLAQLAPASLVGSPAAVCRQQAAHWQALERRLQALLDQQLLAGSPHQAVPWGEPAVSRRLARLLPAGVPLVLANSSPVRDWESFSGGLGPLRSVLGCRGASGIDGTLSTACGVAEAAGQAVLLSGDLALLHDSNGWLWRQQLGGRLLVVLIDNGGGGIFEQLPIRPQDQGPQGSSLPPDSSLLDFERLFAMPQAVDQAALAAAHGVPSRQVDSWAGLEEGVAWGLEQPLALLVLRTDRRADAAWRLALRRMACSLVDSP
jgi:2-succinyl-5-enolpyruvyl-6-hydroxy-3-cyclohexene-1-carboxylate synthase